MSIQLEARINGATTLAELLADASRMLPAIDVPFVIESALPATEIPPATEILVAPFEVPERGPQRYKEVCTLWSLDFLRIALEPIAAVHLSVAYTAAFHELEPWPGRPEATAEDNETFGYKVRVNAGVLRTRASFCLAALLVCAVASRNRSRIVDDMKLLNRGWLVDPAEIAAMFARHRGAKSFAELSDAFCDELNFAPNWPRAVDDLARPWWTT